MKKKSLLAKFFKQIELGIRRLFLLWLRIRSLFRKHYPVTNLPELLGETPKILLLRQDRIGDAIITTPLIAAIRSRYPKATITMLLGTNNQAIAPLLPGNCDFVIYTKNPKNDRTLTKQLREAKYDVLIDLTDNASVTSSILVSSIAAKISIGIEKENKVVYDIVVPRINREEHHITRRIVELLRPLGIDPEEVNLQPQLNVKQLEKIKGRIAINISAGSSSRYAPEETYASIAKEVAEIADITEVKLACEPSDKVVAERIAQLASHPKVNVLPPTKSYAEFASLLTTCEALITPDTSVVHLGSAIDLPMVVVYAPIPPGLHYWTPVGVPFEMMIQRPSLASLEPGDVIRLFGTLWQRIHNQTVSDRTISQNPQHALSSTK